MINFYYENNFNLDNESKIRHWIHNVITSESYVLEEINYIFCDDNYLHKINLQFLNHDTYTDIITFDNSIKTNIISDIYISTERVQENAILYKVDFFDELLRVIIHGILHLCGYSDKTDDDKKNMRLLENKKIKMFHVEQ